MWTEVKLKTILFLAVWHMLLAARIDRKPAEQTPRITSERNLNFYPLYNEEDEVYISNQSQKNKSVYISKHHSSEHDAQPPPPAPVPVTVTVPASEPPPSLQQTPCSSCPTCYCPPCPECVCPPCSPCSCPPCQCPERPRTICIEETAEYEEVVERRAG